MGNAHIYQFYDKKIRKVCDKRQLKAAFSKLNPTLINAFEDNQAVNKILKDNFGKNLRIPEQLHQAYKSILAPEYEEFTNRLIDLIQHPIVHNPQLQKDIISDAIIYNHLRIMVHQQLATPKVYVRKDKHQKGFSDLQSEWLECDRLALKKSYLMDYAFDEYHNSIHTPLESQLSYLFGLVVGEMFDFNHSTAFDMQSFWGKVRFGENKLKNRGCAIKDYHLLKKFESIDCIRIMDEKEMVEQIGGVLGLLFLEDHTLFQAIKDHFEKGYAKVVEHLKQCINNHPYSNHKAFVMRYKKDNLLNSLKFCNYIDKERKALDFWHKDSPVKALYLTAVEYNKVLNALNRKDENYFSYDRMINDQFIKPRVYMFDSKAAMRRFFALPEEVALVFLEGGVRVNGVFDNEDYIAMMNVWDRLILWLKHTPKPAEIKPLVVSRLKSQLWRLDHVDSDQYRASLPYAIELLYRFILPNPDAIADSDEMFLILDYMSFNRLSLRDDGIYEYGDEKNMYSIGKETTIRSLLRKSREWHRLLLLERKQKYLLRSDKPNITLSEELLEVDMELGDYRFHLINNQYDLSLESFSMSHCVDIYGAKIRDNQYVVFQVSNTHDQSEFPEKATLGLKVQDGLVEFDQCKGYQNSVVSPNMMLEVSKLIDLINQRELQLYLDAEIHFRKPTA